MKEQHPPYTVKNTIEQMVLGLIETHKQVGDSNSFFNDVERFIACLFVGRLIDNSYVVRSRQDGNLDIRFSVEGHCTEITFLLPKKLQWKLRINETAKHVVEKQTREDLKLVDPLDGTSLSKEEKSVGESEQNAADAYEHAKKYVENMM